MSWTKERYQRLLVAIYDTNPRLDWDSIANRMNEEGKIQNTKAHIRMLRRTLNKTSAPSTPVLSKGKTSRTPRKKKGKGEQSGEPLDPKTENGDSESDDIKEKIEKIEKVEDVGDSPIFIKEEVCEDRSQVMDHPEEV